MNNKFSEFFRKDNTLTFSVVITIVVFALNLFAKILISLYALAIIDAVFLACIFFLFRAYCKHVKNVQKGLLGAILMWYLYDEINYVLQYIIFNPSVFKEYDNAAGYTYLILSIVTMLLFAALFVNHFIINGDHHSRPVNILINQILITLISVISLVSIVFQFLVLEGKFIDQFEALTWHTGLAAFVTMIASYEAHFDAYKIEREKRN